MEQNFLTILQDLVSRLTPGEMVLQMARGGNMKNGMWRSSQYHAGVLASQPYC